MRRLVSTLGACAFVLLMLGLALQVVLAPAFTRTLVARIGSAGLSGLSTASTLRLAEEVRIYVTDPHAPDLPAQVDGRAGFDERQVSHLDDVARVIVGASRLTWALVVVALVWAIAARRAGGAARATLAAALKGSGVFLLVGVVVAGFAGMLDFDALFTRFHGLFFAAGTWQFYSDDLLVQLFPERFWVIAGGAWGLLTLLLAGLATLAGAFLGKHAERLRS